MKKTPNYEMRKITVGVVIIIIFIFLKISSADSINSLSIPDKQILYKYNNSFFSETYIYNNFGYDSQIQIFLNNIDSIDENIKVNSLENLKNYLLDTSALEKIFEILEIDNTRFDTIIKNICLTNETNAVKVIETILYRNYANIYFKERYIFFALDILKNFKNYNFKITLKNLYNSEKNNNIKIQILKLLNVRIDSDDLEFIALNFFTEKDENIKLLLLDLTDNINNKVSALYLMKLLKPPKNEIVSTSKTKSKKNQKQIKPIKKDNNPPEKNLPFSDASFSDGINLQRKIISILANKNEPFLILPLIEQLNNKDILIQQNAIFGLRKYKCNLAYRPVKKFFYNKNNSLKKEAILTIGNYSSYESFNDLTKLYIKEFNNIDIANTIEEVFKTNVSYTMDMIEKKISESKNNTEKKILSRLLQNIYQFKLKK